MGEEGATGGVSERGILFLLGAIQFVNILEFMMVMPLGPDFAKGLGIPVSEVGLIAASYTGAAAISGLVGALFLDRFDRRRALFVAALGLTLSTFAGGFAVSREMLMVARAAAGVFGGPATSLAMSIVADVFPPERRGRAIGAMLGAFSVASVVGVPLALEVARFGTWRAPFIGVGMMGFGVSLTALSVLPPMTGHLAGLAPTGSMAEEFRKLTAELWAMASRRLVVLSWTASFVLFTGAFVMIPNMASYLTGNLHYPREKLALLYMSGGVVSFGVARVGGFLIDRIGASKVNIVGVVLFLATMWAAFGFVPPLIPLWSLFGLFMTAMTLRNMSVNVQASRVPTAQQRARFASVQSTVQHVAASCAAVISSALLTELPDKSLAGMRDVLAVSTVFNVLLVPLAWAVERGLAAQPVHGATSETSTAGRGQGPASTSRP